MQTFISKIKERIQETHDVISIVLSKPGGFSFIPGQFCLMKIMGSEKFPRESRPFTFSCSPTDEDLMLTIKVMGEFTNEIGKLEQGDEIEITGPNGQELNFDENIKDDVVFIAGGSGITPFMSAIRYAVKKGLKNNITLLFSNRTEEDIIYRKELDSIDKDNISIVHTLTNEVPEGWEGETGYVDEDMIKRHIKDPKDRLWFICGPPPMTKAMRETLEKMEVPKENIRIEPWEIPGRSD